MPPLPTISITSRCGKSFRTASTEGAAKLDPPPPVLGSVPVGKPALSMHSGQRPSNPLSPRGLPQMGHDFSFAIFPPTTKEDWRKGYSTDERIFGLSAFSRPEPGGGSATPFRLPQAWPRSPRCGREGACDNFGAADGPQP